MAVVTQDIKISCHNSVIKGHGAKSNDGHPWRNWKITLVAMDGEREVKGKLSMILDHVEYILHPTFEEPRRVKKEEPYVLQEKGWGEFDMRVVLYFTDNITDPQVLLFDLNFALASYSITHSVEFPNASPELVKLLSRDPSSAPASAATSAASTPRKGGKKPAPSTSSSDSSRQAKKKPISSSPHSKTAKKAKPEAKSTTLSKKSRKSSTSSSSPAPASAYVAATPQSPIYDQPSPSGYSTHSSPSLIATSTPDLHPVDTEAEEDEEEEETKAIHSRSSSDSSANRLVDHTYKIADVYNLNPIHHAKLDKRLRDKWDIPDINMMELAKRIYRMSPEQTTEFRSLIFENTPEGIKTVIDPGMYKQPWLV
ncbi:yeats family-domain-containing protein [Mucor lusitanicus]|uniref:Protein AF-9 homolog n=1 Tax=Mucor circinelloides f. lusitanicus TaxID=29924 RepID=A0A8H4BSK0_MUCCL|nr:yeats family-domain-containing protein [Mucor lusitanicus]